MNGVRLAAPDRAARKVFVNASLRFDSIAAIGFDMDYTVAIYDESHLEETAFGHAIQALAGQGYPAIVGGLRYRPRRAIRGLVIDRQLGNVLKTDRYHHVSIALHGARELGDDEKRTCYPGRELVLNQGRFVSVDTMFSLPDVDLYCQLVALRDAHPRDFRERGYATLWDDVRAAVDLCHRDMSLKQAVISDPARYLVVDPELAPALAALRRQGKKLFLLTNSELEYTDRVMGFLLDGRQGPGSRWIGMFDAVVCEAGKPGYFLGGSGTTGRGSLADARGGTREVVLGGQFRELEEALCASGPAVLFAGDHIYGDVIRSKRLCAWRTVFVIPELEDELSASARVRPQVGRYLALMRRLEVLDRRRARLAGQAEGRDAGHPAAQAQAAADREAAGLQRELSTLERRIDRSFHPQWGALLNDGGEISRFGAQTEAYADLYTARVPNLARYPADMYFRTGWDGMPHTRARGR